MSEQELVVVLGRGGPLETDWKPIQEMVIRPCPPNADASTPLQVRVYRRDAGTGEIMRTFLSFWPGDQ